MKSLSLRTGAAAALVLLFGTLVPAQAQPGQQREKEGKPENRQGGRQEQAAPPSAGEQPQQRRQERPEQQQQQQRRQGRQEPAQPERQRAQQPQQQPQQTPQVRQQRAQQPQQQQQRKQPQVRQQVQQAPLRQPQMQRTQQQATVWQQQRGWMQGGSWRGQNTWQQGRAQNWSSQHRTWGQRGGYGGYYIPQSTFSLSFGNRNWFRMSYRPTLYMGYPRFSYGGYQFMILDPWPEYWQEDWYDTDDVYIDYSDGYYLYNRRDPQVRLAISVAM